MPAACCCERSKCASASCGIWPSVSRNHRDPDWIEHPLVDLLKQRIFGLCLGYEDLRDHDALRQDPLLAVRVGKTDVEGRHRLRRRDQGMALAGKSTLNRLELTPVRANADHRYKKISAHLDAVQEFLVEAFRKQQTTPPTRIVLDVDATDDPVHGDQLGRFFHGYYKNYCFLLLYIVCGDHPLLAVLRPSNIDASTGLLKHLARIVARLREVWPDVEIVVRGRGLRRTAAFPSPGGPNWKNNARASLPTPYKPPSDSDFSPLRPRGTSNWIDSIGLVESRCGATV